MDKNILSSFEKSFSFLCSEVCKLLCALLSVGDAQRLLLVVVEVAGVTGALALRDEWSINLIRWRERERASIKASLIAKSS